MAGRARRVTAITRFQGVAKRAEHLLDLYDALRTAPHNLLHSDLVDLPRSAIVLSVAGMDSYFTGRFAECLVPYLKKHGASEPLVSLLSKAGLGTRQALDMITMQRPYRRVRTLMDAHFERYTTQRAGVIDDLFAAYRLSNFCENAQRSVRRANLVRRVELVVERRHRIVHEGDLNDHHKPRRVDAKAIRKQLQEVGTFVAAAQTLSANRL